MTFDPLFLSLPVADRRRAHEFYRDALGLQAVGEPADDGIPEPLVFVLNEATNLMLIPSDGFGWVIGEREVAAGATSECVVGITAASEADVDAAVARAVDAGGTVVSAPGQQPWGYVGSFTDPDGHLWMVTSVEG